MVMARPLYSLLTNVLFCLPTNPGAVAIYVRAMVMGQQSNAIVALSTVLKYP